MKNYLVALILGVSIGFAGGVSYFRYTEKPCPVPICAATVCPKCPPNSIDINKLKDFRGRFIVNQTYEINSDSISRELLIKDIKKAMTELKLSRCK